MEKIDTCKAFKWQREYGNVVTPTAGKRRNFGRIAALVGHRLWLSSGIDESKHMFVLDLRRKEWKSIKPSGVKVAHCRFLSANLYKDKIYMCGANLDRFERRDRWVSGVFVFDPVLKQVSFLSTYGSHARPNFIQAHSADVCERLSMLASFGGRPERAFNQLRILDFVTKEWTIPKCKGNPPPGRNKHASCISGTVLFIYHGRNNTPYSDFYMIDLSRKNQLVWHNLDMEGAEERGRIGAGMVYVGSGRLLVFGGFVHSGNTSDLLVIENVFSPKRRCRKVDPDHGNSSPSAMTDQYRYTGIPPFKREAPRMARAWNRIYVVGGNADDGVRFHVLSPG